MTMDVTPSSTLSQIILYILGQSPLRICTLNGMAKVFLRTGSQSGDVVPIYSLLYAARVARYLAIFVTFITTIAYEGSVRTRRRYVGSERSSVSEARNPT